MANAQVILKEKIEGLGAEADVVKVRAGYARNYLVPQGKAYEATKANLRHVETLNGQSIDGDTPLIPLIPERFSIDADALREILTLPGNGENIPPGAATINPILLPPKP